MLTSRFDIRLTDDHKLIWQSCAAAENLTVTKWITRVVNAYISDNYELSIKEDAND